IQIQKEPIDWFLDLLAVLSMIAMVVLLIKFYPILPDTIPHHYGLDGQPDRFGHKGIIFTLPIIGFFLFVGMTWLASVPHVYNYPGKITPDNAEGQYRLGARFIRFLNAAIVATFAYLTYSTILSAVNNGGESGPGIWFLPVFLGTIFGSIGLYLYLASRKKHQPYQATGVS
ncbi:MAG: DUF1648 domain-containing protein, partial [Bacteroidota bacterium]